MKKIIALLLTLCLSLGTTVTIFATDGATEGEIQKTEKQIFVTDENAKVVYEDSEKALVEYSVQPRENNYGNVWLNASNASSFPVYTTYSGTLGFTFKIEANDNSSWAYVSVQKPDKNYFWNNVYVGGNAGEVLKTAYGASSGTYNIHYAAYTSAGMRLMCWIYKR